MKLGDDEKFIAIVRDVVSDDRASIDSRPLPCFALFVSLDGTFDNDGAYGGCIVSWWKRIIIVC